METKIVTGKVRFSYANVFTPTAASEGGQPKYNISILIDKTDKATLDKVQKAIDAVIEASKDKLSKGGKLAPNIKLPLRDGDEERPDDEAYAGKFFLNANSNRKPQIVDANLDEIIDPSDFYSGCYGRASITFYAFNKEGNRGIACGLNNLQKLEDGENLTGSSSAADDFADELA